MVNGKKIVLVIPALHSGGMERVMAELAEYFALKKYIDLHLILYGINRDVFYKLPANITIHKPTFKFNNQQRIYSSIKTLFFLRKRMKDLRPDAILSFGEYWNSFVLLSLFGLKYPIYISDRCQPDKKLVFLHAFLRKLLYPVSKGVIAQTEMAKDIYKKYYFHSNVKVIGNPIREIKAKTEVKKENIVLSVGRLIKSKHHDELIKLFVRINKPNWKLVIVGDDALKQENKARLQSLISELDAENLVILAGKQTDVEQFYLKSKIFAFTSSSEGFPNVIGEAQSAGLPVVAFDCVAGPSEMIRDCENGYLIPLFNYQLFQQRLSHLMESPENRIKLGSNAKLSIQEFSKEKICSKYLKFILNDR